MTKKENEILIHEITQKGPVPRYRLVKEGPITMLYYADSPNITQLGYPFQILSWALPTLLNTSYRDQEIEEKFPNLVYNFDKYIK